jgi:predicted RNase H-like HicB family nuclease
MTLPIQLEQEIDGRWFGIVEELPGVMAYGASRDEAAAATRSLALRVLADRIDHGDTIPEALEQFLVVLA